MMKKWIVAALGICVFLGSCKNDDDINEPSTDDQNSLDDQAILAYLEDHYFEPNRGLIKSYSPTDSTDDDYPNLLSQGTKLPSGVWIVKRNGVEANGRSVQNNLQDSILISYHAYKFVAVSDLDTDEKPYSRSYDVFMSTINTSGSPQWDPVFYYNHITPSMAEDGINLSHYVIEGFVEGLKQFPSTETDGIDPYNFQGAILVPSRLAYGRDINYLTGTPNNLNYRNCSFVFNIELHKVVDRQ